MTENHATVLLEATLEILNKFDEGPFVKSVFGETNI